MTVEMARVIPAKAGIQQNQNAQTLWMPASAGMTKEVSLWG
jgi:hypothetical protein